MSIPAAEDPSGAWLALGQTLAALRKAAGYTQHTFAPLACYGRSTIANAETGHQRVDREFWVRCDTLLGADGALIQEYDRMERLTRGRRRHQALVATTSRHRAAHPIMDHVIRHTAAAGSGDNAGPSIESLRRRIFEAHEARASRSESAPALVLIGGYAGSGKTELGRMLAGITGWTLLDKDQITRPLVEDLLSAMDRDPNDRHSEAYLRRVRPVEYRCVLNAAFAQLDAGGSCIVSAPFLHELPNPGWLQRLTKRCSTRGIGILSVWVDADVDSMYEYLVRRDAARDSWKLNHWDTYAASVDPTLRPALPHFVVDNARHATAGLFGHADAVARILSPS
ncbi:helix-turn-helix domain-containing protein [Micromonospora tarensis]|uniref:AAA family ATPase n=1 Tax=Micromonospora tarensis TaxID=2806100 RepID=A0ABS1YBP1_9ACTN|nr:helix-turn-helix domain-containing protein [Micromonospora tarensis]MBM0274809.1 AAA family ATPase [Micromonospora tarensis]